MIRSARTSRGVLAGLLLLFLLPSSALAAAPTANTGAATAVEQSTATLNGSVNPRGNSTVAFFQYGGNRLYGQQTPEVSVGSGTTAKKVSAPVSALAPFTTYHYRIVTRDGNRLRFGSDRTFKTDRQPLGLSLAASPESVEPGGETTLTGNLSGTNNSGRQVLLQQLPFGTSAFVGAGNPQVTDATGNFAFPILDVNVNTAYRVTLPSNDQIISPVVFVVVPLEVKLKVERRVKKGRRGTFKGTVSPSVPGAQVEIQNKFEGTWVTIAKTKVKSGGKRFERRPKLSRGGRFRAVVTPIATTQGYVPDTSSVKRVKVRRFYKN